MTTGLQTFGHTFHSAVAGTAAVNGSAFEVAGLDAVGVQVAGVATATLAFEATIDGSNWASMRAYSYASGSASGSATADGLYLVPCTGLDQVRVPISSQSGGTITVSGLGVISSAGMV